MRRSHKGPNRAVGAAAGLSTIAARPPESWLTATEQIFAYAALSRVEGGTAATGYKSFAETVGDGGNVPSSRRSADRGCQAYDSIIKIFRKQGLNVVPHLFRRTANRALLDSTSSPIIAWCR
jgi:hypothetical protein